MAVDTAGQNFFGALHQRVAFLEGVGFHGNSCAMILAAIGLQDRQRESYLPARGSSLQNRAGRELQNSRPVIRILLNSVNGDMPDRPAAEIAAVRRPAQARRAAWRARAACTERRR